MGGGFGGLRAAQALKSAPVEVTLLDRPLRGLAHGGEGFREQIIDRLARDQPRSELSCLAPEGGVVQPLQLGLERVDAFDERAEFGDHALVGAEDSADEAQSALSSVN